MPKSNCAAFNCKNHGVHWRPSDNKLRKLWEESLNKNNALPLLWLRPSLCAAHFNPDDYLRDEQTGGTTDSQESGTDSSESESDPNIYKGYKCNACKKQFKTYCLQFRHQITHKHYCICCRRSFFNRSSLCTHKCRVCDVCNICFTRKTGLTYHKKFVCPLKINRWKHEEICERCLTCSDCLETFPTPTLLRHHLMNGLLSGGTCKETYEKVECPVCEEQFEENFDLASHMRKHSAPARSYRPAKRQLTGAVDKITISNERQRSVTDVNGTECKIEIDATTPTIQTVLLEDIKKELEERQIDINEGPLEEDTQLKRETDPLNMGTQAEQASNAIVQRICSDWSDDDEQLVELGRVKQEPEEC